MMQQRRIGARWIGCCWRDCPSRDFDDASPLNCEGMTNRCTLDPFCVRLWDPQSTCTRSYAGVLPNTFLHVFKKNLSVADELISNNAKAYLNVVTPYVQVQTSECSLSLY
ncbi:hypothetical protein TGGT1_356170 [Toxoplasma gondii GT1]|uniref:Uncharacterized protein n=4 Tax=Toxoplasma gondii TaxID=5811 RepID=A0A125YNP9_TOXGV|nr:hypothetical protein TGGT1_356170 [Toxoplasma gondii GT1]ESS36303.1 hypothetical protein TGVEG_356170 [Toxoplasma gondii VEG]KFG52333.1 hypothetical protein TGP89_356170 [Toxoplasma gondii p89]KFG54447.1 hypothetical protein TGFOU_356170 [Toxoplasma gondii FOU]